MFTWEIARLHCSRTMQSFLWLSFLTVAYAKLYWMHRTSFIPPVFHQVGSERPEREAGARFTNDAGITIPGRGHEHFGCWVAYQGVAYHSNDPSADCEILVLDKSDPYTSVSYVSKTLVDGVPPGAVIGGHTADGFPLYNVRALLPASLDARNNYAEYYSEKRTINSTDWEYVVVDYKTRVVALRYLFGHQTLDRTSELVYNEDLFDGQNLTCLLADEGTGQRLQVAFDFPSANISHEMSVEVVTKHVDDCTSSVWTWYTESTCTPGQYQECKKTWLWQEGDLTRCLLTCMCATKCDYLYVKFEQHAHDTLTGAQLCEVKLTNYGPVEPGLLRIEP